MRRVLAIGAHPDDVEASAAGYLLHHEERHMLVLSEGERGGCPRARGHEAAMAAGKLGAHLTLLQYPDTHMVAADLIGVIENAVKALRPDLVLVPSARDSHQDHRAVHAAALSATRAATCTLLAYMSASAAERVRPNWFVPLTEKQMALKLESIACHHSQVARPYMTEEHVRSMGRYWAMVERSAAPYVEPFELVRYRAPC